jgi:hypothetical protein
VAAQMKSKQQQQQQQQQQQPTLLIETDIHSAHASRVLIFFFHCKVSDISLAGIAHDGQSVLDNP